MPRAYRRVAELEQENARLRDIANGNGNPSPSSSQAPPSSESENNDSSNTELGALRAQLAEAKRREAELAQRLEQAASSASGTAEDIKRELYEPTLSAAASDAMSTSSGASSPLLAPRNVVANPKTGASLGIMVRAPCSWTRRGS